jgi:hypothetical protein
MNTTQTFISSIRDLIAKDDVKTAIQALSALLKDSPRLDEAVQQSARYNNVMKHIRLGLVDFAAANIAQNQISYGVLELLREIEEQEQAQPSIKKEVEQYVLKFEKNVLHNSTINAGGNVTIGDTYIQYPDRQIPRFLTQKPFYTEFFIGRDPDLAAIETDYTEQKRLLVLVNGEGGMGKTTLAAQYWHLHEARYTHLAWVFADSGVGNALLSLAVNLGIQFHLQDDEKAQIRRITEGVNNLAEPCLLVFDNANNADDLEKYMGTLRRLSNCHILLTSRVTALADVPVHRVLPLKTDFAVQVFTKHYPKYATEGAGSGKVDNSPNLLHNLLHAVGYNTLVIELLAKNLAVFNKFQTQYPLQSLVTDLQERGLFGVQGKAVKTLYQADTLRTETPDRIIATLTPNPDVWARIEAKQAELHALYAEAAENIYKNTSGEAFLGEKNVAYAQYWAEAVKKSPKAVTGEFDISDFDIKTALFPSFVKVYNAHNAVGSILAAPYDILAKDILRYATDAKKAFEISSDAVCKQALKDTPQYRKLVSTKPLGTDKVAEKNAPLAEVNAN